MSDSIAEIIKAAPLVNPNRRYWIVRTQGGEYYHDFLKGGFIAIAYDKIALSEVRFEEVKTKKGTRRKLDVLEVAVRRAYGPELAQPRFAANQLVKFVHDIHEGDIVIVPSAASEFVTFGEVTSKAFNGKSKGDGDTEPCPWVKRKKVHWMRTERRNMLPRDLYRALFSHQTLSEVSSFASSIDSMMKSFYVKDGAGYLVFRVLTPHKIPMDELFGFGTIAGELFNDYCVEHKLSMSSSDINARIQVQSEGHIILDAVNLGGVVLIGAIIIAVVGGGGSFKWTRTGKDIDASAELHSDGLIEKLRQFLYSNSARRDKTKALEKILADMKVENPEDLVSILKELQEKGRDPKTKE